MSSPSRLAALALAVSAAASRLAAAAPAPAAAPDPAGVMITATEVRLDGKRLAVTPARLAASPAALVEALALGGPAATLTYTADAPAEAVLAALRAIDDAAARATRPPPDHEASINLDEGKMGKRDVVGPTVEIAIRAVVGGTATEICRARLAPEVDPADDPPVDLVIRLGLAASTRQHTRINTFAPLPAPGAALDRALREEKAAAFFADRGDVVIAAEPKLTGAALTPVVTALCQVGFTALRPIGFTVAVDPPGTNERASGPTHGPREPLAVGTPTVDGEEDQEVILRVLRHAAPKLKACGAAPGPTKPRRAGVVTARFTIAANGKVSKSDATGDDPALTTCVRRVIKALVFPRPMSATVAVTVPLTFVPGVDARPGARP
jgi:hypothetical protein